MISERTKDKIINEWVNNSEELKIIHNVISEIESHVKGWSRKILTQPEADFVKKCEDRNEHWKIICASTKGVISKSDIHEILGENEYSEEDLDRVFNEYSVFTYEIPKGTIIFSFELLAKRDPEIKEKLIVLLKCHINNCIKLSNKTKHLRYVLNLDIELSDIKKYYRELWKIR